MNQSLLAIFEKLASVVVISLFLVGLFLLLPSLLSIFIFIKYPTIIMTPENFTYICVYIVISIVLFKTASSISEHIDNIEVI